MAARKAIVKWSAIALDELIHLIRGQRVMIDEDIARLYGIQTKVLNQAVARNRERFPLDFAFRLTAQEFTNLKSQFVTSSFDHGGRRKLPWAFTEQGVAMLSSVLRSPIAVGVNIEIMRGFVRIRRLLATPGELISQLQKLAESVKLHDEKIRAIEQIIDHLVAPQPEPPRGRFGFHPPSRDGNS
jgi:ORF6N domain-containing protein